MRHGPFKNENIYFHCEAIVAFAFMYIFTFHAMQYLDLVLYMRRTTLDNEILLVLAK